MSSAATSNTSSQPMVYLSYECIMRERLRESTSYVYEVGCGITHLAASAHLFMRVTGEHTYRSVAGREIPFTRSETGVTAYIELLEGEQLEVRIVGHEGTYDKAVYSARGRELTEDNTRRIASSIQRIDAGFDTE